MEGSSTSRNRQKATQRDRRAASSRVLVSSPPAQLLSARVSLQRRGRCVTPLTSGSTSPDAKAPHSYWLALSPLRLHCPARSAGVGGGVHAVLSSRSSCHRRRFVLEHYRPSPVVVSCAASQDVGTALRTCYERQKLICVRGERTTADVSSLRCSHERRGLPPRWKEGAVSRNARGRAEPSGERRASQEALPCLA